jgi:hypothetical protein
MRYIIEAIQYGASNWAEICQVQANPQDIVDALMKKKLRVKMSDQRWGSANKYSQVRIVDTSGLHANL